MFKINIRYWTSPVRVVVDNLRIISVWIFFMVVPTVIQESFHWLQLLGFLVLVLGTLIYNEILILPFWGFDKNTKVAKEERLGQERNIATEGTKISFVHR